MRNRITTPFALFVGLLTVALIGVPLYFYISQFGTTRSTNPSDWGSFSDFMGFFVGLANLLVTIAIAWFIYSLQQTDAKVNEENTRRQRQKDRIHNFSALVAEAMFFLRTTQGILYEYLIQIDKEQLKLVPMNPHSEVELEIITKQVDRISYYYDFKEALGMSTSYEMFRVFDVLLQNYKNFQASLKLFIEKDYALRLKCTERFEHIRFELAKMLRDHQKGETVLPIDDAIVIVDFLNDYKEILKANPADVVEFNEILDTFFEDFLRKESRILKNEYEAIYIDTVRTLQLVSETKANKGDAITSVKDYQKLLDKQIILLEIPVQEISIYVRDHP